MKTLAEEYFEEALGFTTAGRVGRGIGGSFSKDAKLARARHRQMQRTGEVSGSPRQQFHQVIRDPEYVSNIRKASKTKQAKVGTVVGQAAYGTALAGGAYLAYKGIKKLMNKFRGEKDPEKRAELKKKIDAEKQKIKK